MELDDIHKLKVLEVVSSSGDIELKAIENGQIEVMVKLKEFWSNCPVRVNDTVHIINPKLNAESNTLTVDNQQGFVVINPDTLITSTALMSANFCMRKAWLAERFRGSAPGNEVMIVGDVVHQLFQLACKDRINDIEKLREEASAVMQNLAILNSCYSSGLSPSQLFKQVDKYLPCIVTWVNDYFCAKKHKKLAGEHDFQVVDIVDIEENLWSPRFGVKGKVDVTFGVYFQESNEKKVVPLELKTGKPSFSSEHEGQVDVYLMMMQEKYGTEEGLLLYLKDGLQMKWVKLKHPIKRDLIQLRNQLVDYLRENTKGPPPKSIYNICSKCDHLLDCSVMLKTFETSTLAEFDVMKNVLVPSVTSHLSRAHLDFFKNWISLLQFEMFRVNEKSKNSRNDFWNFTSKSQEELNLAFGKMIVKTQSEDKTCCSFERSPTFKADGPLRVDQSLIQISERVALSLDEEEHTSNSLRIAFTTGFVTNINDEEIELELENPLNELSHCLFRIDLLPNKSWFNVNFVNLLRLMDPDCSQAKRLRELIIDHRPISYVNKFTKKILTRGKNILKLLKIEEQKLILKALSTDSYYILRDLNKDDKASIIVSIIRLLMVIKQTVLICSNSNSAIDEILLKLKSEGIDEFVRLGKLYRVHKDLQDFVAEAKIADCKNVEDLEAIYSNIKIVATTVNRVSNHPIFDRREFNFCIVDEASQMFLPTCLGPLFSAKRFILFGKSEQMANEFDKSLLKELN